MREHYWITYSVLEYQLIYYKNYQLFYSLKKKIISCFCLGISLSSVAAWSIWKTFPLLWSFCIALSQLIQVFSPYFLNDELALAAKMIITPLDKLLVNTRHDWLSIENSAYSDDQIVELIHKYEQQYSELTSLFFSGTFLPESRYVQKKTEAEWENNLEVKYHIIFSKEEK